MPRLRRIRIRNKYYSAKIRQEKSPGPPMELGGDPYIGDRGITKKVQKELGFSIGSFCFNCYVNKLMSCQEIRDALEQEYGYSFTRQWIWVLLKHYGVLRSQAESMKVRAITGRMDYAKSTKHIDYKHRKIDYKKIYQRRKNKVSKSDTKIVQFNRAGIKRLKRFAKDNKLTVSDAIKIKFYPKSNFKKFIARLSSYR